MPVGSRDVRQQQLRRSMRIFETPTSSGQVILGMISSLPSSGESCESTYARSTITSDSLTVFPACIVSAFSEDGLSLNFFFAWHQKEETFPLSLCLSTRSFTSCSLLTCFRCERASVRIKWAPLRSRTSPVRLALMCSNRLLDSSVRSHGGTEGLAFS